jgi:hypothetical protein
MAVKVENILSGGFSVEGGFLVGICWIFSRF